MNNLFYFSLQQNQPAEQDNADGKKASSGAANNPPTGNGNGNGDKGGGGDKKKESVVVSAPIPPSANALRILVLAQKGDWTGCESALKALERVAIDEGGNKHPLTGVSDNVRLRLLNP
jgi:hypothetical protein